ncbi:5-oxoprolinase subunit B family protein [Salinispora vitiensis]|uniref:5-oxoprolinase subunit B family protein n=1 Tax=Salinispora vitiensis TaxID=999544 RepID=UPI0003619802|nr:allophanate hydrolase subunit 1 [Salinispora vitiensis]
MRIRPVGAHALLLDCSDANQVEAWRAELWRRRERGDLDVVEIIPAARTVLLDGLTDPAHTAALLGTWDPSPGTAGPSPGTGGTDIGTDVVEVPVRYDGADLPTVAGHWDVAVPTVVRRLIDTEFRVAFCGFAPGFAYLTGLPVGLAVPRLPTPRPRVPAGSVALAGPYAGIYPTASPGGWLLVGHTDLPLFDVHADPPARLTPGTRVRLVPA